MSTTEHESSKLGSTEVQTGKYRHYKGNLYEVLGIAKHSESLEAFVVYRALYGDFGLWIRPYAMFLELVQVNGQEVARFTYLPES